MNVNYSIEFFLDTLLPNQPLISDKTKLKQEMYAVVAINAIFCKHSRGVLSQASAANGEQIETASNYMLVPYSSRLFVGFG